MKPSELWIGVSAVLVALAGVFFQGCQIREAVRDSHAARDEFKKRLEIDYQQRQLEIALELWDSWNETLYASPQIVDDTRRFQKWAGSIPKRGQSDASNKTVSEYNDWLTLFVLGSKAPSEDMRRALQSPPTHVLRAFSEEASSNEAPSTQNTQRFSEREIVRIRNNIVVMLNLLEKIAVAYQKEIADRKVLDYAFRQAVVRNTIALKPFLDRYRSPDGEEATQSWQALYDLVLNENAPWRPAGPNATQLPTDAPWRTSGTAIKRE